MKAVTEQPLQANVPIKKDLKLNLFFSHPSLSCVCCLSPLALGGSAPPLLRDAVDLLQLLLLVVAERSRQTLVPGCISVLDP